MASYLLHTSQTNKLLTSNFIMKRIIFISSIILATMLMFSTSAFAQNQHLKKTNELVTLMPFNSNAADFAPTFLRDELVFASTRNSDSAKSQGGEVYTELYSTAENGNLAWATPSILAGKTNTKYHEGPAVFTKSGGKMYFTRNVAKKGAVNLKIYESRFVDGKWGEGKELTFCSNDYSVGHPAISKDNKTIYFVSDMPGGLGGMDLYVSTYIDGTWSTPQNLGSTINSAGNEVYPFVHEDGSLYFASDGLGGYGDLDIFGTAFIDGKWEVANLGATVNSSKNDFGLILNEDKSQGFFASNRSGGKGSDDIYMLTITNVQPEVIAHQSTIPAGKQTNFEGKEGISMKSVGGEKGNEGIGGYGIELVNHGKKELRLVLIGIVLDKTNRQPIANASVTLIDDVTQQEQEFKTQQDGNFYFKLEPEKNYQLSILDNNGKVADTKAVSTINRKTSEILHAILEGESKHFGTTSGANDNLQTVKDKKTVFTTYESEDYSRASVYNEDAFADDPNKITFKIQIGAFEKPKPQGSSFLTDVPGPVTAEKTGAGLIRYVVGAFDNLANAEAFRKDLINRGYSTAFVAAYISGHRIEKSVEKVLQQYK